MQPGVGRDPWRGLKVFAFGLALFVVGGYFVATGYVLVSDGSMNGNGFSLFGVVMMLAGIVFAVIEIGR